MSISRTGFSRYSNFKEILESMLYVFYFILKMATFSSAISEKTRQNILGIPMAIILCLIVANGIIYTVVMMCLSVVELFKATRSINAKKTELREEVKAALPPILKSNPQYKNSQVSEIKQSEGKDSNLISESRVKKVKSEASVAIPKNPIEKIRMNDVKSFAISKRLAAQEISNNKIAVSLLETEDKDLLDNRKPRFLKKSLALPKPATRPQNPNIIPVRSFNN